MRKRIISIIMILVFVLTAIPFRAISAEPIPTFLYVNGVDVLAEGAAMPQGVSVVTGSAITLTLDGAKINGTYENGNILSGIYAMGIDLNIVVAGDTIIEVNGSQDGKNYCGIVVSAGNLNVSGTANLTVCAPYRSIYTDGRDISTGDLTFTGNVSVLAKGEIKAETFLPEGGRIYAEGYSDVIANSGYFCTGNGGNVIKGNTAKFASYSEQMPPIGPSKFNIGGTEFILDENNPLPKPEDHTQSPNVAIGSGTGWTLNAVGGWDDKMNDWIYRYNLKLSNYNGGAIEIHNGFNTFFILDGENNIQKNADGFSIYLDNTKMQTRQDYKEGMVPQKPVINLEGGIRFNNSLLDCFYTGNWTIGSSSAFSPKGIVGEGKYNVIRIVSDTFHVFSEDVALNGLNEVMVEDMGVFTASTNSTAMQNVTEATVKTGGKIDITYVSTGTVTQDCGVKQLTSFYKSTTDAQGAEPVVKQYFVDCKDNVYIFSKDNEWSDRIPITGVVETERRKYTVTDEQEGNKRHYIFTSTANKIARVFADESGAMIGGNLKVSAVDGYNYGGYVVEPGATVNVEIFPWAGYRYKADSLAIMKGSVVLNQTENPLRYTFTMPQDNVCLYCAFDKIENTADGTKSDGTQSNGTQTGIAPVPETTVQPETKSEVKPDGSLIETKIQSSEDTMGNQIEKTEVVIKDASGNVTGGTTTTQISDTGNFSKATIVVATDASGNVTSTSATVNVNQAQSSVKDNKATVSLNISKDFLSALDKTREGSAGDKDLKVSLAIEKDVLKDILTNQNVSKGVKVNINIPTVEDVNVNSIKLMKDTMLLVKESGQNLTFSVAGGTEKTPYTITIPASQLDKAGNNTKPVDLSLNIASANDLSKEKSKLKELATEVKNNKAVVLTLSEDGKLPVGLKIEAPLTQESSFKKGEKVYIYRHNPKTKKLEEVPNNEKTITKSGSLEMSTNLGGDFVIAQKEFSGKTVVKLVDKVTVKSSGSSVAPDKSIDLKIGLPDEIAKVTKFSKGDPFGKEEAKVSYKVSNKTVAAVSSTGKVTGKKEGSVTVTVTILLENQQKKVVNKKITIK